MKYISTRGGIEPLGFSEAVMTGMARDGGLLLPERIPNVSAHLEEWSTLSYVDLAFEIMRLYADLPDEDLSALLARSYSTFSDEEIAPVVPVGDLHILELFHGPTLAFKDVALQFLGSLFEYNLQDTDDRLNILTATSGDTGSAAIQSVRGKDRIHIFVMHPTGRTSRIQELQMTTVLDENVSNLAVEGTFDDCQNIMKAILGDLDFKDTYSLGSANSINWGRLLAQVVYYFYAAFRVQERTGAARVSFSVPTGNFGDIFAGYIAAKMGLPVASLILATNENDILARFFNTGVYSRGDVVETYSPSMDIQVASNFERYLYYRLGCDSAQLSELMRTFADTGSIELTDGPDELFVAGVGDTEATLATIRAYEERTGYLMDPHTAVGVHVAEAHLDPDEPVICLATAHPAKFGAAIEKAIGRDIAHHSVLDSLHNMPTRCETMPASAAEVKALVARTLDSYD